MNMSLIMLVVAFCTDLPLKMISKRIIATARMAKIQLVLKRCLAFLSFLSGVVLFVLSAIDYNLLFFVFHCFYCSICPKRFKTVKIPVFFKENVHHHISVIKENPETIVKPFNMQWPFSCNFSYGIFN